MGKVFSLIDFVPVHKYGYAVNSEKETSRLSDGIIKEERQYEVTKPKPICISESIFPDSDIPDNYYEGAVQQVLVNRYERSQVAREKCIEFYGCKCKVCGMDFEKEYGELGQGFIHVHHIIPIHEIGKEYELDYKNDLIPVCPNCHAMLHRTTNGERITLQKLMEIINRKSFP